MLRTKFLEALRSLSAWELKRFDALVRSPFFNRNPRALALWAEVLRYEPDFQHSALEQERLFPLVFPEQPYEPQRLRLEVSHLFSLLKVFLAFLEWEADPWEQDLAALQQFAQRAQDRSFYALQNTLEKQLDQHERQDSAYFFARYRLAQVADFQAGKNYLREYNPHLQAKVDALDRFYLITKLRESCAMLNRQNIIDKPYRLELVNTLIAWLGEQGEPFQNLPLVRLYFQVYLLLTEPKNEAHYWHFRELLDAFSPHIEANEALGLFKYALNYCIRRTNAGEMIFRKELLSLYQSLLANELLLNEDQKLAHTDFKNIVTTGLRSGAYEWTQQFMEDYANRIQPPHQDNVYQYCRASWLAETGKASQAIALLRNVSFSDIYYETSSRLLQTKILYDTQEAEGLSYQINAFSRFLQRNREIAPLQRRTQFNFLKYLRQLARLRARKKYLQPEEAAERVEKLKQDIQAGEVAERGWLLRALEQI
jgi:hypothetical protein